MSTPAGLTLAFRDRPPTPAEFERLRLALSTYRDGSGQTKRKDGTQPGWRDFERAVAEVLGGIAVEKKAVFDVLVPPLDYPLPYGLSCKLSAARRTPQILMELSNAHAQFTAHLQRLGINARTSPEQAGEALIELIELWHQAAATMADIPRSSYLVLTHDSAFVQYQLLWYDLCLRFIEPSDLSWQFAGKRIFGVIDNLVIWEWYGWSGGQLKYYPLIEWARWVSKPFALEVPPVQNPNVTLAEKAARYWPEKWAAVLDSGKANDLYGT